jgi:hypothetical protein
VDELVLLTFLSGNVHLVIYLRDVRKPPAEIPWGLDVDVDEFLVSLILFLIAVQYSSGSEADLPSRIFQAPKLVHVEGVTTYM